MNFPTLSFIASIALFTFGCAQATEGTAAPEPVTDSAESTPEETKPVPASTSEDTDGAVDASTETTNATPESKATTKPSIGDPTRCLQPRTAGRCKARFTVFGFDPLKGKCVQYFYGGCEGSENRFETMQACNEACNPAATQGNDK